MPNAILELRNIHVEVEGKRIIKGVSLGLRRGSIHAIMGPNGSGKSTLAYAITGRPGYNVVEGDILLEGKSILGMEPEERALAGIFLAFQDPPPLPGVKFSVLAVALSNKKAGLEDLSRPGDPKIYKRTASILEAVGLSPAYASRELH
ncbi:MAG: ATP-binding cassette domain-containing protein, partial [Desulfurococcales archaeon]|nr:ATP-binding cassette domain-containing protein [Desulfurococcales archaeon]